MKKTTRLVTFGLLIALCSSVALAQTLHNEPAGSNLNQDKTERPATLPANAPLDQFLTQKSATPAPLSKIDNSTNTGRDIGYVLDQDQPLDNAYMAAFYQPDLAQSFIPSSNSICGAGISVFDITPISTVITITLWDNLPNAGGNQLATGSAGVTLDQQPVYADVFWPSVSVTPGLTYYIVFTSTNGGGVRGHTENPYPFGMVYANAGFIPFPTFDYTFHTFTCNDQPSDVPLANWSVFLAIALIGGSILWIVIRKKV